VAKEKSHVGPTNRISVMNFIYTSAINHVITKAMGQ
jgi:hypothetical protein